MLVFDRSEYLARGDRVKARMSAAGIDVLLCADPANINYLTGYDSWSFYVHQYATVSLDADEPIWIGRAMDAPSAYLTTFLKPENIRPYPETHVDSTALHPAQFVAGILKERDWDRARIGVELDAFYFTARAFLELAKALPGASLVDAQALVNWVRLIKAPAELEKMRAAGVIASRAMAIGIEAIEPGVRECDAVARITAAQIQGTSAYWGDYPAALALVPSGRKSGAPHMTWSGDRYEKDTIACLELGGCHHRYHAALARTLYMGRPPAALLDIAKIVAEGLDVALDAARTGVTCHSVEAAWRAVISRAGYTKASRIGYSIGLNYPPDWGERTASLREGDKTVLEPNMCFHMILGMWMDDWGFELGETFCVRQHGAPEILTAFTRDLLIKP